MDFIYFKYCQEWAVQIHLQRESCAEVRVLYAISFVASQGQGPHKKLHLGS